MLEPSVQRDAWELDTRIGLGFAYLALRGWGALEIETTVQPALALSEGLQRMDQWLAACYLVSFHWTTTLRLDDARDLATTTMQHGERFGLESHVLMGHAMLSAIAGSLGDFETARRHTDGFHALYDLERDSQLAPLHNMKCLNDGWAAHHLWIMGWPDQAKKVADDIVVHARLIGNPFHLILCLAHGGACFFYRREADPLHAWLDEASRLAKEHVLDFLDAMLIAIWRGGALVVGGRYAEGYAVSTAASAVSIAANSPIMLPAHRLITAEALAGLGRVDEAIAMLDGEIATIAKTRERMHEAEILRLRGVLTLRKDASESSVAEAFLTRALELSRTQKAKGWELRTSTSLGKLWQNQGKRKEALKLLKPIYDWFTEGFDTKDLKEAKALLDALS